MIYFILKTVAIVFYGQNIRLRQKKNERTTALPFVWSDDGSADFQQLVICGQNRRQPLFYCINNCLKCLGLVHCEVSQNLAVHSDTLCVVLTHKL